METGAQQTFIPHEIPTAIGQNRARRRGGSELFSLVSLVLFVASGALAAGVFLYAEYLEASAASKTDQLERAKAAFEPSLIHELTRLDDRMRAAGEVLGKHVAPTAFFKMLEQTTIGTISFSSLSFDTPDAQHLKISMKGIAASVNAIALQADLFSKGGMVVSPIFSDIDRRAEGVNFSLVAQINPAAINYAQGTVATAVPVQQQQQPQQQQPTSPFGGVAEPGAAGTSTPSTGIQQ